MQQPLFEALRTLEERPEYKDELPSRMADEVREILKDSKESEIPVDKTALLDSFKKVADDLEVYYVKQINSLDEIRAFCMENRFDVAPAEVEVDPEILKDLKGVTVELLDFQFTACAHKLSLSGMVQDESSSKFRVL